MKKLILIYALVSSSIMAQSREQLENELSGATTALNATKTALHAAEHASLKEKLARRSEGYEGSETTLIAQLKANYEQALRRYNNILEKLNKFKK